MKTKIIFLLCMALAIAAIGQNQDVDEMKNVQEQVEVTAPKFTGIENVVKFLEGDNVADVNDFLKEQMQYPEAAIEDWAEGTEVIQFVVTPTGQLTNFKVINSVNSDIDEELIRILKTTNGMWSPGLNNGEAFAMEKEISMVFALGERYGKSVREEFTRHASNYFAKANKTRLVKNKHKRALRQYNQGIRYLPNDQALLLMRGLCRYELGDEEGAREDWNRMARFGDLDERIVAFDLTQQKGYEELASLFLKKK